MIKVINVYKRFGDLEVLKDVTLNISKGQILSIIGPSGSGKSTLLRCMNLLEVPEQGQVWIGDQDITAKGAKIREIRQNVSMVFQHFHLFPNMTVLKNLMYAPKHVRHVTDAENRAYCMELLERVGLTEKANEYPSCLSGGQKQRVAIARSLAMKPEIILFDEPTSALDPEMVKEVLDVIQGLACTGITMVLVTHEMGFAREVSDRIVFLDNGVLIEDAPPQEFFTNPKTERARSFLQKML